MLLQFAMDLVEEFPTPFIPFREYEIIAVRVTKLLHRMAPKSTLAVDAKLMLGI